MADQTTDKGDAAAQKAYESAVAAKSDSERKPVLPLVYIIKNAPHMSAHH